MAHISKNLRWIFHFRFRLVFIKLHIFVQQKASMDLKSENHVCNQL